MSARLVISSERLGAILYYVHLRASGSGASVRDGRKWGRFTYSAIPGLRCGVWSVSHAVRRGVELGLIKVKRDQYPGGRLYALEYNRLAVMILDAGMQIPDWIQKPLAVLNPAGVQQDIFVHADIEAAVKRAEADISPPVSGVDTTRLTPVKTTESATRFSQSRPCENLVALTSSRKTDKREDQKTPAAASPPAENGGGFGLIKNLSEAARTLKELTGNADVSTFDSLASDMAASGSTILGDDIKAVYDRYKLDVDDMVAYLTAVLGQELRGGGPRRALEAFRAMATRRDRGPNKAISGRGVPYDGRPDKTHSRFFGLARVVDGPGPTRPEPDSPLREAEPEAGRIWNDVLVELAEQVTRPSFDTWLKDSRGVFTVDGGLVVEARDTFTAEMLAVRMGEMAADSLKRVSAGAISDVKFVTPVG